MLSITYVRSVMLNVRLLSNEYIKGEWATVPLFNTNNMKRYLKQLESEGLVTNLPHVGPTVKTINMEDLEKIYPIRIALEGIAARMAVKKIKSLHGHDSGKTDLIKKWCLITV